MTAVDELTLQIALAAIETALRDVERGKARDGVAAARRAMDYLKSKGRERAA